MRMRFLTAAAVALAALTPSATLAQKSAEPTVEFRLRSVNDVLDKVEYVAGLAGQEEGPKQVRALIAQLSADGKGIEGLDPKKPFGAYAVMTDDVVSSPVIVMIPIADEARFLAMMKERLSVTPEKAEGGALKAFLPLINDVHMKFANGYLYVTLKAADLDARKLVSPQAFFAKDDGSVASLLVRLDRIPAEVKKVALGQFELQINEERKKKPDGETDAQFKLKNMVFDVIVGAGKSMIEDGKELAIKFSIDPKSDDISAELAFTPKSGTTAAKNFASLAGKTSLAAGITNAKNVVARTSGKIEATADMKQQLGKVIDELIAEELKKAGDRAVAERIFDAISPTLKAGVIDYSAALIGPDPMGRHTALAAFAVKDAKEIEKLLKEYAPFLPEDKGSAKFDVETIGAFALHKIEVKDIDVQFVKIFGGKTFWLATSDDTVALSIEPDGTAIRAALKAKPAPVSPQSVEVSLAKVVPLADPNLKPDELKALLKDAFGDDSPAGKDTFSFAVEGGDKLSIKLKVKGKGVRLLTTLDQFKGK